LISCGSTLVAVTRTCCQSYVSIPIDTFFPLCLDLSLSFLSLCKPVFVYMYVSLCIRLSVNLSFCVSVYLCLFLSIYQCIRRSVHFCTSILCFVLLSLSVLLSLCFSLCFCLSVSLCIRLSVFSYVIACFFVSFILSLSSSSSQFPSPDMCTPQAHHTFSQYLHYRHYIGRISLCQSDNPKPFCFWSLILLHKVGINKSMFS
jgi:hypothetical protein